MDAALTRLRDALWAQLPPPHPQPSCPAHCAHLVTLRSRPLTRVEWDTMRAKHYDRLDLADHFWVGMRDWLSDPMNTSAYYVEGGLEEAGDEARFVLRCYLPDRDTGFHFRLRWM